MKKLYASILVLFTIAQGALAQNFGNRSLPCSLVWKRMNTGNRVTEDCVASHISTPTDLFYVVRSQFDSENKLGVFDTEAGVAIFPLEDKESDRNSSLSELTSFEILTNPHECELEWLEYSRGSKPNKFTVAVSGNSIVAKGVVSTEDGRMLWYSGDLTNGETGIYVPYLDEEEEPLFIQEYQVLISYSSGVTLELTDFTFDTDPFADASDFLGVDEIHNYSPSTIKQTIKHSKTIIEEYKVTTNRTWTSTYTETFKINLIFFSIKKTKTTTYQHAESEVQETKETTEISVSRLVEVPEFQSIQACTVISIKECASVGYSAKARYSAKGMDNVALFALLKDEISGARIDGDYIVVDVTGSFDASLAMNTEFIIRPYHSEQNCDAIKFDLEKKNRKK